MITIPGLAAEALGSFLTMHMGRRFGATHADLIALIPSAARLASERIGYSDALYHGVEHTMLVPLVGYNIMKGRSLLKPTSASDYAHLIVACLFHDIGNSQLLDARRISDAIEFTRFPFTEPVHQD